MVMIGKSNQRWDFSASCNAPWRRVPVPSVWWRNERGYLSMQIALLTLIGEAGLSTRSGEHKDQSGR